MKQYSAFSAADNKYAYAQAFTRSAPARQPLGGKHRSHLRALVTRRNRSSITSR